MFAEFNLADDRPACTQLKEYMKRLMITGVLQANQKLPSTNAPDGEQVSAVVDVLQPARIGPRVDLQVRMAACSAR